MSSFGRTFAVLRTGTLLLRRGPETILRRKASDVIISRYRQAPVLTPKQRMRSEIVSSVMWFWILWHLWHDPDAVFGHFTWPDPSRWTDEELGIPPDEE